MRPFRYVPALDGVRALAIVLVVLSHSVAHTEGGGIGVHIFFVLSGFLITSLILQERELTGRVSYRHFYARRALRLLPALMAMLVLVALLPNVYLHPLLDGTSEPRYYTIPITLFYGANIANGLGFHMGYLGHAWSLSIEEQFYFLWPIAASWLITRGQLVKGLLAAIALFALGRLVMDITHVRGTVDWPIAHADQLLIGALLAWRAGQPLPAWVRSSAAGVGALGVLLALTLIGSATHQGMQGSFGLRGGLTVCAVAAAVLIAHLVSGDGWMRHVFAWLPVVWIGRVSYGIYLFHFPIFQYVAHKRLGTARELIVEYALLAIAVVASWFLIERPALRLKSKFEPRTTWPHPPGESGQTVSPSRLSHR